MPFGLAKFIHHRLQGSSPDEPVYNGGGKNDAPAAPNYAPVAAASERSAELAYQTAQDQLAWAKERDLFNQAVLADVLDRQTAIGDENRQMALEDRAYQLDTFRPIEQQLATEAAGYDTPQRRALEAGRAAADVSQQFANQRGQLERQLQSAGIDPNQGRFAGSFAQLGNQAALGRAGAVTNAVRRTEDVGRSFKADVAAMGRGLPSAVAGSYGTALNAANSMNQGANQSLSTSSGALSAPVGYMGAGNQALGVWGNTLNMGYQNQLAGYNASNQTDPLGALLGFGASAALSPGKPWMFGLAHGGRIRSKGIPVAGKRIQGPGTGTSDSVPAVINGSQPAALSDGEYVIPADVVRKKGQEFFDKLVDKYHNPQEGAKQYADGGTVAQQPGRYRQMLDRIRAIGPQQQQQFSYPTPAQVQPDFSGMSGLDMNAMRATGRISPQFTGGLTAPDTSRAAAIERDIGKAARERAYREQILANFQNRQNPGKYSRMFAERLSTGQGALRNAETSALARRKALVDEINNYNSKVAAQREAAVTKPYSPPGFTSEGSPAPWESFYSPGG